MAAHALTARMEKTDLKFPFLVKSHPKKSSDIPRLIIHLLIIPGLRYYSCLGGIVFLLFAHPFMNLLYWEKLLTTVLAKRWINVLGCLAFTISQDYEMYLEGVPLK